MPRLATSYDVEEQIIRVEQVALPKALSRLLRSSTAAQKKQNEKDGDGDSHQPQDDPADLAALELHPVAGYCPATNCLHVFSPIGEAQCFSVSKPSTRWKPSRRAGVVLSVPRSSGCYGLLRRTVREYRLGSDCDYWGRVNGTSTDYRSDGVRLPFGDLIPEHYRSYERGPLYAFPLR
jgi:hypothetical protein